MFVISYMNYYYIIFLSLHWLFSKSRSQNIDVLSDMTVLVMCPEHQNLCLSRAIIATCVYKTDTWKQLKGFSAGLTQETTV